MTQEAADLYKDKGTTWIKTYTGTEFHLEDPIFTRRDIAHALANNCRFNGHTRSFYSVAEHSMLVSALVYHMGGNSYQCLEGLLHDATEAYLSDVPAPFKQLLPDWRELDRLLDQKLRQWAALPSDKTGFVKEADWIALFIEAHYLIPGGGKDFTGPQEFKDIANRLIEQGRAPLFYMDPDVAETNFMLIWEDLAEGVGYDSYGVTRKGLS